MSGTHLSKTTLEEMCIVAHQETRECASDASDPQNIARIACILARFLGSL